MSTVQLAIRNQRYATALADLLRRDGAHQVVFTEAPDLTVGGIIVIEGDRTEGLDLFEAQPERLVVLTRRDAGLLARVWDAGVRHVVFEEDSPSLAMLAVIAAELRDSASVKDPGSSVSRAQKRLMPAFPIPILETRRAHFRTCSSTFCKTLQDHTR